MKLVCMFRFAVGADGLWQIPISRLKSEKPRAKGFRAPSKRFLDWSKPGAKQSKGSPGERKGSEEVTRLKTEKAERLRKPKEHVQAKKQDVTTKCFETSASCFGSMQRENAVAIGGLGWAWNGQLSSLLPHVRSSNGPCFGREPKGSQQWGT